MNMISVLLRFYFPHKSYLEQVFLVSSVSGYHKKEELHKYGHLSLRNLLSKHFHITDDGLTDDTYFQVPQSNFYDN